MKVGNGSIVAREVPDPQEGVESFCAQEKAEIRNELLNQPGPFPKDPCDPTRIGRAHRFTEKTRVADTQVVPPRWQVVAELGPAR